MLLLLLLGHVLLVRIYRCRPVASAVCSVLETFVYFACAHSTPRALAYVNAQPPRHGVINRTLGSSRHVGIALGGFGPGFRRGCVRRVAHGVHLAVSRRAGPSSARNKRKRLGEPVLLVLLGGITGLVREWTFRTLV